MGPPIDEQFYRMPESKGIIITTITKCHPKRRHDESNHLLVAHVLQGSPGGSDDRESACSVRDTSLISGLRRCSGKGNGYPLQYCCMETSGDRGVWRATVHGITDSRP